MSSILNWIEDPIINCPGLDKFQQGPATPNPQEIHIGLEGRPIIFMWVLEADPGPMRVTFPKTIYLDLSTLRTRQKYSSRYVYV